ncbi:hypothetical protein [Legionella fairfieldensis]|uniref:hypothetical protein n=1 Tax=Legionella fairfieldensis TaxID=45064 RepID=UPI000B2C91C7|nr:hypothetical protein [Legionella fairfieldensis]
MTTLQLAKRKRDNIFVAHPLTDQKGLPLGKTEEVFLPNLLVEIELELYKLGDEEFFLWKDPQKTPENRFFKSTSSDSKLVEICDIKEYNRYDYIIACLSLQATLAKTNHNKLRKAAQSVMEEVENCTAAYSPFDPALTKILVKTQDLLEEPYTEERVENYRTETNKLINSNSIIGVKALRRLNFAILALAAIVTAIAVLSFPPVAAAIGVTVLSLSSTLLAGGVVAGASVAGISLFRLPSLQQRSNLLDSLDEFSQQCSNSVMKI